jgi:hypothetical protein
LSDARGHSRRGSHIVAGLVPAYIGGGIVEIIGAVAAFVFIRRNSLQPSSPQQSIIPSQ